MKTAIFVDGAFFIKRARKIYGMLTPDHLASRLFTIACKHVAKASPSNMIHENLYRIFFYDCPPLNKKMEHPLTKKQIDYSTSIQAQWRRGLHQELKHKPKVALRLGVLDDINCSWMLSSQNIRKLCNGKIKFSDLTEDDITLSIKQKGVDMRIGLDIASLSYKKQADRVVLISGDSDFVPAAKLARREGMEFVLDPMWASIKPDLQEHIDHLYSPSPRPQPINKPINPSTPPPSPSLPA